MPAPTPGGAAPATTDAIVRFAVEIDPSWMVTITPSREPAAWAAMPQSAPFQLAKVDDGHGGFLPASAWQLHAPDQHDVAERTPATGESLYAAHDSIITRQDPQIAAFGHYLYDALFAENDRWKAMAQFAESNGASVLEVGLALGTDDHLRRLNWEMLHSDSGFLAAGVPGKLLVAITRLVGPEDAPPPAQLGTPPRALFVIGTSLDDEKVRPGAEVMGLLRRLRSTRAIRRRVLQQASPSRISAAVREFRPDVVHFICHGGVDGGRPYLAVVSEDGDRAAEPARLFAEQLAALLRFDDQGYPGIVVLSACHTGGSPGAERYVLAGTRDNAPLAEALVRAGAPIVIGMSGRITDLTCRLFTRRFGETIVSGDPLVVAIAKARTAAFTEGLDVLTTPDWALPALFVARSVPPDHRPIPPNPAGGAWDQLAMWGAQYQRDPIFCGRAPQLEAFQGLFAGPRRVLALHVEGEGFGRRRMLEELALTSLYEGHVPLLVDAPNVAVPLDVPQLASRLAGAFLSSPFRSASTEKLQLAMLLDPNSDKELDGQIAQLRMLTQGTITPAMVGLALRRDLERLVLEVRRDHPDVIRPDATAVLLIDKIERYGVEAIKALFTASDALTGRILGPQGVGTSGSPIPVVVSFSRGGTTDEVLRPVSERSGGEAWLRAEALGRFEDGEASLAYRWVLLNPSNASFPSDPGLTALARKGWAVADVDSEAVKKWDRLFRERIQGQPARLISEAVFATARTAVELDALVEADDERFLAAQGSG